MARNISDTVTDYHEKLNKLLKIKGYIFKVCVVFLVQEKIKTILSLNARGK